MKKVLITDGMDNEFICRLTNLGFEVFNKSCDENELIKLISDFLNILLYHLRYFIFIFNFIESN